MALTWKNVDAPNFNGAGALFESAQNSFNSSLDMLRQASDRAAAQRKADASARMLSGLAGVQRGGVADFLSNQDAAMLTPEALQIALGQEDVLAGRASKEVELQNAQGDLAFETNSRQGDLASRAARAQAQLALSQGDFTKANTIMDNLSGYALDDSALAFGANIDDQTFQNDTRARISELVKDNDSIDAARIKIMNGNYSERERAALNNQLNSMSDDNFSRVDPNLPDVFSNTELSKNNQLESQLVQQNIQSRLESNPTHQFDMHLKNMTVNPEGTPEGDASGSGGKMGGYADPIKYLGEQMGLDTKAGYITDGLAKQLQDIKAKANAELSKLAQKTGAPPIQISDWEAAAAIASTRKAGSAWLFDGDSDKMYADADEAVKLAVSMKDQNARSQSLKSELALTGQAEELAKAANAVQSARKAYNTSVTKNSSTSGDKYEAAINADKAYQELLKSYWANSRQTSAEAGEARAPSEPVPVPASAATAAAAEAPMPAGPDIPDEIVRQALLAQAANKAEIARKKNQKPISVVLPSGVISKEMPAIMGDGSTVGPVDWNNISLWPSFR